MRQGDTDSRGETQKDGKKTRVNAIREEIKTVNEYKTSPNNKIIIGVENNTLSARRTLSIICTS